MWRIRVRKIANAIAQLHELALIQLVRPQVQTGEYVEQHSENASHKPSVLTPYFFSAEQNENLLDYRISPNQRSVKWYFSPENVADDFSIRPNRRLRETKHTSQTTFPWTICTNIRFAARTRSEIRAWKVVFGFSFSLYAFSSRLSHYEPAITM